MTNIPHHYDNNVLEVHEEGHAAWIEKARAAARSFAIAHGVVTSDDIWEICPPPKGADPRVLGAVFKPRSDWERVDYRPSIRRQSHGRPVAMWVLRSRHHD